MTIGIGTGSTVYFFIHALADAKNTGLKVTGVPTSKQTEDVCLELDIPMTDLEASPELDLTVDGADEIDPNLNLIKGGGGALLREKIVASASKKMIVIADSSKQVPTLGKFPLPIEIEPFGMAATIISTKNMLLELGLPVDLSMRTDSSNNLFVTDGGHHIVDASIGKINNVNALGDGLATIPGVIEHGLFVGLATTAIIGSNDGTSIIEGSG